MIKLFQLAVVASILFSGCASAVTLKSLSGRYDIKSSRVAHIKESIVVGSFKKFEKEMVESIRPGDRIVLINSGGGLVDEGQKMIELINTERKEGTRIVCVVLHAAHSMAFNFLTNCDVRLAVKKSFFLVHKVERVSIGKDFRLTARNLREVARQLDVTDEPYRQANSKAMGLSLADYDLLADQETMWQVDWLVKRGYLNDVVEVSP